LNSSFQFEHVATADVNVRFVPDQQNKGIGYGTEGLEAICRLEVVLSRVKVLHQAFISLSTVTVKFVIEISKIA
jgi:hypothetical protein